jgi:hypothetical protein
VTTVAFPSTGWAGGNYSYLSPVSTGVSNNALGWSPATVSPCVLFTNNTVNDVTVSTLVASFDHANLRSLWQCYQAEHNLGQSNADSDELLLSMGIKAHPITDYSVGIAVNFADAVNVQLSWELIR